MRSIKLNHVFEELRKMGVKIEREDVEPYVVGGYMDRQAIGKFLVANGYAPIIKNAWIDFLDHIPYIPGELITPKNAFDAISAAGGKSFMAHFHLPIGLKGYTEEEVYTILGELKGLGLEGMEYYYPSFTNNDRKLLDRYIIDFGFIKSGGTDFHGANRAHIKLGVGEGNFKVPNDLLLNIV